MPSPGNLVEGFFGGYTAAGGCGSADIAICSIKKANANVKQRLEQIIVDVIGMVVVDEVHLISGSNRGYILEFLFTRILFCSRNSTADIRIVTISATLPNAKLVLNWLNAEFYQTDYRPIELGETIKIGNQIFDRAMNPLRTLTKDGYTLTENEPDSIAQLCIQTSKDWCEKLAILLAQNVYRLTKSQMSIGEQIRKKINLSAIEGIKMHLKNSPTGECFS